MSEWRWDDCPSPEHISVFPVKVFRVPKGGKLCFRLLAPFRGLWTHYVSSRTGPCNLVDCKYCASVPARWKGYASAEVFSVSEENGRHGWFPGVVEITEEIRGLAKEVGLVGSVIELARRGEKKNAPLIWSAWPADRQPRIPPKTAPFDISATLEKLFDLPGRHLRPFLAGDVGRPELVDQHGEILAMPSSESRKAAEQ